MKTLVLLPLALAGLWLVGCTSPQAALANSIRQTKTESELASERMDAENRAALAARVAEKAAADAEHVAAQARFKADMEANATAWKEQQKAEFEQRRTDYLAARTDLPEAVRTAVATGKPVAGMPFDAVAAMVPSLSSMGRSTDGLNTADAWYYNDGYDVTVFYFLNHDLVRWDTR